MLQIIDAAALKNLLASNIKVVVYFTAKWCGSCEDINPKFSAMSTQFKDVVCVKVDVEEVEDVSELKQINCTPSFKFYLCGVQVQVLESPDDISLWKALQALHLEIQTTTPVARLLNNDDIKLKKFAKKIRGSTNLFGSKGAQPIDEEDDVSCTSKRRERKEQGRLAPAAGVAKFWCTQLAGFSQEHFEEDGATTLHLTGIALDRDSETAVLLCSTQAC